MPGGETGATGISGKNAGVTVRIGPSQRRGIPVRVVQERYLQRLNY